MMSQKWVIAPKQPIKCKDWKEISAVLRDETHAHTTE